MRSMRPGLNDEQELRMITNRTKIAKEVFPLLRKEGIMARVNYLCCQSCAGYALGTQCDERKNKGFVFWHSQDEEQMRNDGDLLLAFTGKTISTLEVGQTAAKLLKSAGLCIEWDGTEGQRILVKMTK